MTKRVVAAATAAAAALLLGGCTVVGTPQAMKPYLVDGSSSASILWNVENLGYLTAWTGAQLAEGKTLAATNKVNDAMPAVTRPVQTVAIPAPGMQDRARP